MYLENLRHVETQQTHTNVSKCPSSKYFVTYQVKDLEKLNIKRIGNRTEDKTTEIR